MKEAGCDEAGRGCLAGPVYAAAVILPKRYRNRELNDSKQLTRRQRERLREEITSHAVSLEHSLMQQQRDRCNEHPPRINNRHAQGHQRTEGRHLFSCL
ncbi:MAG: hypothetical protein MZV63_50320 [Marinilabiliales bacterium]|nr:hypothetical protein [Marinilabiliales bacterium]